MQTLSYTVLAVVNRELLDGAQEVTVTLADAAATQVCVYTGRDWIAAKRLEQSIQRDITAHPQRSPVITVEVSV